MTTKQRTDIHRPGEIIPANYTHLHEFGRIWSSYDPDDGADEEWDGMEFACTAYEVAGAYIHGDRHDPKAVLRCDICGARYKFGSLFAHTSGEVISVGHDCAHAMHLAYDKAAALRIKGRSDQLNKARLEYRRRFRALKTWARSESTVELRTALRHDHRITKEIRARLVSTGAKWGLSEAQIALVLKLATEPQVEEKLVAAPIVDKRQTVEGTIVSLKLHDGDYGSTWKMTVKVETPEGNWLAWGTLPATLEGEALEAYKADDELVAAEISRVLEKAQTDALKTVRERIAAENELPYSEEEQAKMIHDAVRNCILPERKRFDLADVLKGRTVRFDARLKAGRDEHFAIISRPTKGELTS